MAPDIRSIFAQAVGYHQAGRLDEAIANYRQVLALQPDLAVVHHNLGNALCEQGKWAEAEASYRQVLGLQPNFASAQNNLGIVLFERGKLEEAVACYRQALALQPNYAEALNNLGAALCRRGELDAGEACIRQALVLKPEFAGAHDNLGAALMEQGLFKDAEASFRHALALAPGFTRALENLGALLTDEGRLDEAIAQYQRLLQINPKDSEGLSSLAYLLAARGETASALETIHQSLQLGETAKAKRAFVDIVKLLDWAHDNRQARQTLARALSEPWARPAELAQTSASLIKQDARIGASVARAAQAWPGDLPASALFGEGGAKIPAGDRLLLALLTSAQNTDVEIERFLTLARRALLKAAMRDQEDDEGLEFYAALARQCFINEYVFFCDEEELQRARNQRDLLTAALDTGAPISVVRLLAVAAYFPLHALASPARLMEKTWPGPVGAVLMQQISEPQEEARLRATIPRLTSIADEVSRLVQDQYEENPYPRWVRMPPVEKAGTIARYLRQRFPLAPFERNSDGDIVDFLSAGCGTGQLALEIAQGVPARVLAVDLSLASLGYAKRKALELGLTGIAFAQADLLELPASGKSFDVVECSGVLHHMAEPFAGWRALLSLLRPGGFMLVGLYSEAGRRGVVAARQFIGQQGYGTTTDEIRRCRQALLAQDPKRALGTAFGDFFGVSSCRDLLFHAQEQRMRLPAIAAFLRDNGLTFLGFETDKATLQAYGRRFPDDPAATDLEHWDAFEKEKPDIFARMYVFWIQKKATA